MNDPTRPEFERIEQLRRSGLLDSPPEETFDRFTRLASRTLAAPVALISLVETDRQFFKSSVGLPEPWQSRRETPISHSFCRHVVESGEPLVIDDARVHPLVRGNPAIESIGVVAYLGVPLKTADGYVLGSLCVIDPEPRRWTEQDAATLTDLAASVMTELTLRAEVVERARSNAAVRRSEHRLALILDSLRDHAVFTVDLGGTIDGWGVGAERLLGYTAAEAIGRPVAMIFTEEDRAMGAPGREIASAREVGLADDTRWHVRRGGERFFVSGSMNSIREPDGTLIGYVKVMRDITHRKRNEEQAEAMLVRIEASRTDAIDAKSRYRTLVDTLPQLVWTCRADGYCDYLGRQWVEYTGVPEVEQLGSRWLDLVVHPDDRGAVMAAWRAAVDELVPYDLEYRIRGTDGSYRWFKVRGVPFRDEAGAVVRWFGTCTDIDDHRRALELIQEQRASFQTTLASIGDAVLVTDAAGIVTFLNPVARELTGWGSEAIGRSLPEVVRIVDEETREPIEDPVAKVIDAGATAGIGGHALLIGRDGTETAIDDRAAPIRDADGSNLGVVLVFRDITERRAAERERAELLFREQAARRSAQEARDRAEAIQAEVEEVGRAKDRFLAMLSHELRTPINPILLTASARLGDPGLSADDRETWAMIRDNIGLEARLIDDLLDVMKVISGKMPYQLATVDAHEILGKAIGIVASDALSKGIELAIRLEAARSFVEADAARLTQAFWNLIKNAVKFTEAGGSIVVRTLDDPASNRLIIEVEDTGIGIEPDALEKIFNAFEQVEDSVTRRFGGLGLGLAISRSVVEAHGGTIAATSLGPGRGATFRIALRAVAPAEREDRLAPAGPKESRSYRLLLVEDDAMTCRVMGTLLRQAGHEVATAGGFDAAMALASGEFDLVVSDIGLPGRNGFELMAELRRRHGLRGIALTGFGMDDDLRRGVEAGFLAHVTKPVDLPRLEALIQKHAPAPMAN